MIGRGIGAQVFVQPELFGGGLSVLQVHKLRREDGRRSLRSRRRTDRDRRDVDRPGIHPHSLDAHSDQGGNLARRKAMILRWLQRYGPATDRNVKDALFGPIADMNMVRPRITDLINDGDVIEVGKSICSVTGVRVRLVRARTIFKENHHNESNT